MFFSHNLIFIIITIIFLKKKKKKPTRSLLRRLETKLLLYSVCVTPCYLSWEFTKMSISNSFLPDELWRRILEIGIKTSGFGYKDLCSISISCRRLHRLSNENSLWSHLLSSDFPSSSSSSSSSTTKSSTKTLYRERYFDIETGSFCVCICI